MKTSFVIASVLLAGVALEAAAFRVNNNNENDSHKQWSSYQQGDSSEGSSMAFQQNNDQFQINENRNQYNQKLNRNNFNNNNNNENRDQLNHNNNKNYDNKNYDSKNYNNNYDNFDYAEQQRYQSQNQMTVVDRSAGLTREMVEKIAAFQKIVGDNDIAGPSAYLNGAVDLDRTAVKLSGRPEHVTFQNGTLKRLDAGRLDYLYVEPARDTVIAQYHFDRVLAAGSFRSNARDAQSGHYAVAMDGVSSNVTAAFEPTGAGGRAQDARPARFLSADVTVTTDAGTETRAFDDAVERKCLPAIRTAVSAEVARATAAGGWPVIAQMKREMTRGARRGGKLFDMSWKEDDVSMDVSGVGSQGPEAVAEPMRFVSVSFHRKSDDDAYRMRYHFALNNLRWSGPLTVQWAGKKTTVRSADFGVDEINVFVTVDKSYGQQQQQQQSCGQINTNVEVTGLRYDFNETVQSEVTAKVEKRLQRYIEHSLEKYVQESLKQELCHGNTQ